MTLTPEQRAAVERWGQDVCVVAGPGSGKTRVLVERYAWLVEERGFRPGEILAITFTERAAQEIKERLTGRFREQPKIRQEIERAPVATIHGFGARLLRRYAIPAGLDPRFKILDEAEMNAELHATIRGALDRMAAERRDDLRRLLSAWNTDQPVEQLAALYEAWRSSGGTIEQLGSREPSQADRTRLLAATDDLLGTKPGWVEWRAAVTRLPEVLSAADFVTLDYGTKLIHRMRGEAAKLWRARYEEYRGAALAQHFAPARALLVEVLTNLVLEIDRRKFERGVLDFGDLESRTIALLEGHPEIRTRVQGEYEAILMDELQDTNPLQWRLMNLVRREGRFFGVGDLNQSIFGFRHATPESFRQYRQGLMEALQAIDELRGNYRSRPEILETAMRVVDLAPGLEPPELQARKEFPEVEGPVVEAFATAGETPQEREQLEAEYVARRIRELHAGGYAYSKIALLFRQTTGLAVFEQALRSFGVPYVMNLGRGFFEAPEVTDLVNWLRVVANPRDEIALAGVLRSPLAGYADEALYAMRLRASALVDGLPEEFAERLARHRALVDLVSPDVFLAKAMDESGYALGLSAAARANADKLMTMVREWWQADPRPLAEIVRRLDERAREREPNAPSGDGAEAVHVLTMHASKGLEFPVVFLCSLHRTGGSIRSAPVSFHPEHGLGFTWRDPATGEGVHDRTHQVNLEAEKVREQAEANRLLYVGMTRAEERLHFSWAEARQSRSPWPEMVRRVVPPELQALPPEREGFEREAVQEAPEPVLLRPQPSDEPWDGRVTVTELAAFAYCPHRYRQNRGGLMTGMRATGILATGARALGLRVHSLLAGVEIEASEEEQVLARGFHESEWGVRAAQATRVEREFDFTVEMAGVIVRGVIDLWWLEGDEACVVDYKTGEAELADGAWQVRLYAQVLERHLGRPVRPYLYQARTGEAREIDRRDPLPLVERWKRAFREGWPCACGECDVF